jgi:hypothetical protein
MMHEYTRKPPVYKAVQYDGTIVSLMGVGPGFVDKIKFWHKNFTDYPNAFDVLGHDGEIKRVLPQDYIVIHGDGVFDIVPKEKFEQQYQRVPEPKVKLNPIGLNSEQYNFELIVNVFENLPINYQIKLHDRFSRMLSGREEVYKYPIETPSPVGSGSATWPTDNKAEWGPQGAPNGSWEPKDNKGIL